MLPFNKFFLLTLLLCSFSYAQKGVNVSQDPKFEKILNEKRKSNTFISGSDRYRIQIYNGDTETAKTTLLKFKKENQHYDAAIVFTTPTYKVLVGAFKTRIEGERNLKILRKEYKNALLIKPVK